MSRIDELIAEHCPSGVPHFKLSHVAEYSRTRVDAVDLDETNFVGVDNLVADKGGRVDATYLPNTARLTAYEPGDVLLGNIRPYLKKVWLATNSGGCSGDVLSIRINPENQQLLDSEYLYYILSSDGFFAYNMQHAKGAKMPRGNKEAIMSYRIPVPPLEVQREIVRVLDTFSKMEAELEAELEARKQQYEHYRGELFSDSKDQRIVTLGDLCNSIKTGKLDVNAKVDGGAYPFFTCDANPYEIDTFAFDTEAILLSGNGSRVGHVNYYKGKFNAYQRTYVVSEFSEEVHVAYLLQYLHGYFRQYVMINSRKGSVPYITLPMLKNFQIPLPTLEEQERISTSLDEFDSLVNDLSVGLPAELAARRQQYEYYRDKLLIFRELEPAS